MHPPAYDVRVLRRAATVLLALACGCGRQPQRRAAPPPLVIYNTHLVGERPSPPPPTAGVKLLDPGQAPRRQLRYHLAAGTHQRIEITSGMTSQIKMNGHMFESPHPPPTRTLLDLRIVKRHADGGVDCEITIEQCQGVNWSSLGTGGALRKAYSRLRGSRLHITVAPNGAVTDNAPPPPAGLGAAARAMFLSLKAQLRTIVIRLPRQPVGVGARWRVVTVGDGRMVPQSATDISLTSMQGDTAHLSFTVTPQHKAHRLRAYPPMDIERLHSHGTGTAVVDLARPMPRALHQSDKSEAVMSMWLPRLGHEHLHERGANNLTVESK